MKALSNGELQLHLNSKVCYIRNTKFIDYIKNLQSVHDDSLFTGKY